MLQSFVEKKIKEAVNKAGNLDSYTKTHIRKSSLPRFLRNYLPPRMDGKVTAEDFQKLLTKGIKLYINYTLRPKWTLINYFFNQYDSQKAGIILEKTSDFTYYRYYIELVENFIDDNSLVIVTRDQINNLIDEVNEALYKKLNSNVTGIKIRNFLIQLYRLTQEDESNVSLTSTVPFLFIKTFLEDKNYTPILQKFESIENLNDETEIELKDSIKILSGKYGDKKDKAKPEDVSKEKDEKEKPHEDKTVKKTETRKASPQAKEIEKEKEESTERKEIILPEKENPEEQKSGRIVVDFDSKEESSGKKKEVKKDIKEKKVQNKKEPTAIYSKELVQADRLDVKKDIRKSSDLPTDIISESGFETQAKTLKNLFKQFELADICKAVYNGDKYKMSDSFSELEKHDNWKGASKYLKEYFYEKDVDIYNKNVLLFVDVLNRHFNKLEKE